MTSFVFLRPIDATLQRGNVDEVPNNIQRLKVILSKKFQQRFGLANLVAQVNIRNPHGPPVGNAI